MKEKNVILLSSLRDRDTAKAVAIQRT